MRKNNNWTEIEITEGDNSTSDLDNLVLDLNENENPQNYGRRKEILTVNDSGRAKEIEEDKDEADDTETSKGKSFRKEASQTSRETEVNDEDVDLEDRPKPNRAHRRIKNLLGERNQYQEVVRQQQEVIKALSSKLKGTEKQNIESQRNQWERAVAETERQLELAMAENDPKAVAKATRELADAQMRFSAMKAVEEDFDETPDVPEPPKIGNSGPPEAAKEWVERNPWFFKDQKAHVLARTLSLELTNEGKYDPESDEYWDELDSRLSKYNIKASTRKGGSVREEEQTEEEEAPRVQTRRKGSPIGSSRSSDDEYDTQFTRKGNRVSATPTQNDSEMAEKLGVNINDYMKEKFKYANQGYKGYVPIDIT